MIEESPIDDGSVIIHVRLTKEQIAEIEELKQKFHMKKTSEIVRVAFNDMYRVYITHGIGKRSRSEAAPFPIGRPSKGTKEERQHEKRLAIAKLLNADVITKNDSEVAVYKIYEKVNPKHVEIFEQELPVSMLEEKHVRDQYKPSREECEKVLNPAPVKVGKKSKKIS